VSEQVPIPAFKIRDLLVTEHRKDGSDFAQCVLGMADVVAHSVDDAEKQKNGRIAVDAAIRFARVVQYSAMARYSSIASTDIERGSL